MKKVNKLELFFLLILFVALFLLITRTPIIYKYKNNGNLIINEVMSANKNTILDSYGRKSDYIEIYNGYDRDINLSKYALSDNEWKLNKWVFPDMMIKAKEYLIVFASGKDKCDLETRICHTNFRLNSNGETVVLSDISGNIINKISYGKAYNDIPYGFKDDEYFNMDHPTPGKPNPKDHFHEEDQDLTLRINEYITHNKSSHYIDNGGFYDWVEIYNYGEHDIQLNDLYLSDNEDNLKKGLITGLIKAKEYMVIYLTDGVSVPGYQCLNFNLSDDDKKLILSTKDKIIDEVILTKLPDDVSRGLFDDKWYYFPKPTPGFINNTSHFEEGVFHGKS